MRFLKEDVNDEYEEFYYDDVPVTVYGGHMDDVGSYDEKEYRIDWTYKVDKGDVKETLWNEFMYNSDEYSDLTEDEEIDKYLNDHYDELVEKYMDKLLDYYEEDAYEDAQEHNNVDYDDDYYDYYEDRENW